MVSEMSLPTTIMICVGWRKKNKRFHGEIVQDFIFGGQTSNEHAANNHTTEKKNPVCHEPWTMGKAQGEKDLENKRQEGGEETRCGMHGDRHAW